MRKNWNLMLRMVNILLKRIKRVFKRLKNKINHKYDSSRQRAINIATYTGAFFALLIGILNLIEWWFINELQISVLNAKVGVVVILFLLTILFFINMESWEYKFDKE